MILAFCANSAINALIFQIGYTMISNNPFKNGNHTMMKKKD